MPVPAAARKKKFNELAKKDGKLFKLISDNNYPWYIDRLQGGGYIDEYQYNTELIDSLGNFYGFQMHEWISNMRSDYFKLKNLDAAAWSEAVFYWYFTDIAVLVAVTRYNCHLCLTGEAKQKGGCHDYYFLCYLIHIHLFFMIVFTLFPELSYWYCIGL